MTPVKHQFSLFGFQQPKMKVPISKERIEEVKKLIDAGDGQNAATRLREVREDLEAFEQRITNKRGVATGREITLVRNKAGVLVPVYVDQLPIGK